MASVRGPIKLLRRAIKGHGVITTHYGMGYSLEWNKASPQVIET